MTKTLVDTNILVYAHQKGEPDKHAICSRTVNGLIDSDEIVLSVQNIAELSRVLGEKAVPSVDMEMVRQYVFDLAESSTVIAYNEHTVMDALMLSKQHKIHFFDALLAATMQENGISEILTENTEDFKKIKWLTVRNPIKEKE
jgi:predicted nucleic acid-binding protein